MDIQCIEAAVGTTVNGGYVQGQLYISGKQFGILQHRMAFEQAWGTTLQPGDVVMHTCDNPPCINPLHLRRGTQAENNADMTAKGRHWQQGKTHCKNGHEFTEANTYRHGPKGQLRKCRACRAERAKEARYA